MGTEDRDTAKQDTFGLCVQLIEATRCARHFRSLRKSIYRLHSLCILTFGTFVPTQASVREMDVHTIGLIGFALYMMSYFLLQVGRLDGNGMVYCVLNLAAASFVLVSLTEHFNLPSVLIQISWIAISVVGIVRHVLFGRGISARFERPLRTAN